jgi:YidC/Oxa1 family membrane protein insertase
MENNRLLLYFSLFFVLWLLWSQWQKDYVVQPAATKQQRSEQVASTASDAKTEIPPPAAEIPRTAAPAVIAKKQVQSDGQRIHVITDVVDMDIDTRGGNIPRLVLRKYEEDPTKSTNRFVLLTDADTDYQVAQSGLVSGDANAPTHHSLYTAEKTSYRLAEGKNELRIPLHWTGKDGTQVTKTFILHRDDYAIDIEYKVKAGKKDWDGSQYMQVVRATPSKKGSKLAHRSYEGGAIYNQDVKYHEIDFDEMAKGNVSDAIGADSCKNKTSLKQGCELSNGWLAMTQHDFVVAWIPERGGDNLYYASEDKATGRYVLRARGAAKEIPAGKEGIFKTRLVAGPKLHDKLEAMAPGLELTIDYGWFAIIAEPLFKLLNLYHGWFGNWGWAIVFLTISVKGVFYKLSEMSYRSMAKMRKVAPRMKAMKERFGDDRQAMSKAMMEMYKREKINPLSGCLPIAVQMPVFFALYKVLLESAEMRHAPFILWIHNLSVMDPYYILPAIYGLSMFVQQRLNPAPVDPVQKKIMQVMPIGLTFMFAFFPAGLVLYWVVNNLLSITQQYIITRRIEAAP